MNETRAPKLQPMHPSGVSRALRRRIQHQHRRTHQLRAQEKVAARAWAATNRTTLAEREARLG